MINVLNLLCAVIPKATLLHKYMVLNSLLTGISALRMNVKSISASQIKQK